MKTFTLKLLHSLGILILASALVAQTGNVEGTVKDGYGDPLPDATVLVFAGDLFVTGIRTDTNGVFRFDSLGSKRYSVIAKKMFAEKVANLSLIAGTTSVLSFTLESRKYDYGIDDTEYVIPLFDKGAVPSGHTFGMYPFRF